MANRSNAEYRRLRAIQGNPVVDRRSRPGRKKNRDKTFPHHKLTKFERRRVVAWDGEGANLETGTHVYSLLANSRGHYIIDHEGISTAKCFQFFLKESDPKAINVVYGGSYDVNMILRDVPVELLVKLWQSGSCYWGNYGIHYSHRKKFTISQYKTGIKKPIRSFILWDVLGYFQSTFVKACRKWLTDSFADAVLVFDQIEEMKLQRSEFTSERIEDIINYCLMECNLLVDLMQSLFAAMDEADITLIRYDGAGSIAASLLRKNNILAHRGTIPQEVNEWSQYAYSGGRIEAVKVGNTENRNIYRADINSAYPSAALSLPSYEGATWSFDSQWNGNPSSIVEVEWCYRKAAPFYPLWYRQPDGSILYPRMGKGRYFGEEIALLYEFYTEGKDFVINGACNVTLATDAKPFQFLAQTYAVRRKFKDQTNMAHEALKLGMNSIYGKLAQQAGYRNGRIPTYHHLLWAGQITSATRSKLYRAAMQHPRSVIAFATDAIIGTNELTLAYGSALGDWTPEFFRGITIVQAGVYWLSSDGKWSDKYRGFDAGSLQREKILQCWDNGESYTAHLTRFYGLGSAVGLNNFKDYWRVWRTEPRKLDIIPNGKRQPGKNKDYAHSLCLTEATVNIYNEELSNPYPLEWGLLGGEVLRPKEQGVTIRDVEDELLDSYA